MSDDDLILNTGKAEEASMQEFRCPCGDAVFEPLQCVAFKQSKLDPEKLKPAPVMLYRCLSCQGVLFHRKEGGWGVMRRDPVAKESQQKVVAPQTPGVVKGPW